MAFIYKRTEDGPKKKAHWYVAYQDENGKRRTRKGFTDKGLTEQMAARIEQEVMLKKRGLIDPAHEKMADQKAPDREPFQGVQIVAQESENDAETCHDDARSRPKSD